MHTGSTPSGRKHGLRMLAQQQAAGSLAKVEVVPVGSPLDALAELVDEAVAWKNHLANIVAGLREAYRFTDDRGAEHLDARVALFERAMDRCQRFLVDTVKLNLEDRRVRLDEVRAGLVAAVLAGVLRELGHDPEAEVVLGVLDRWLPVLDGGAAPVLEVGEAAGG